MKHFMFFLLVLSMVIFVTNTYAQNQDILTFVVDAGTTPLTVTGGEFSATMLVPGNCYDIPADPLGLLYINPKLGEEEAASAEWGIEGSPGAEVVVQFLLPTVLMGADAFSTLTLSYDGLSAAYTADEAVYFWFNPTNNLYLNLGAGTILGWLSPDLCVPSNIGETDAWEGVGVVMANYVSVP